MHTYMFVIDLSVLFLFSLSQYYQLHAGPAELGELEWEGSEYHKFNLRLVPHGLFLPLKNINITYIIKFNVRKFFKTVAIFSPRRNVQTLLRDP